MWDAFELYRMCRGLQLFEIEVKKQKGKKESIDHRVVAFPTGFTHLPWDGPASEQPTWLMAIWEQFLSGERAAAYKELSSST